MFRDSKRIEQETEVMKFPLQPSFLISEIINLGWAYEVNSVKRFSQCFFEQAQIHKISLIRTLRPFVWAANELCRRSFLPSSWSWPSCSSWPSRSSSSCWFFWLSTLALNMCFWSAPKVGQSSEAMTKAFSNGVFVDYINAFDTYTHTFIFWNLKNLAFVSEPIGL